jgi:hypothetical protein
VDKHKFEKFFSKQSKQSYAQYPGLLVSDYYTNYVNDPLNKNKTSTYMMLSLPCHKVTGTKGECSFPPFGITYKTLTCDVGAVVRQVQLIDV